MDNRTIRTALMKRVPEIYFVSNPAHMNGRVIWTCLARIHNRPYYVITDMPETALVSHRELLNTMVSETYDYVAKIRSGQIKPAMMPDEKHLKPLTEDDYRVLGYDTKEDLLHDSIKLIGA